MENKQGKPEGTYTTELFGDDTAAFMQAMGRDCPVRNSWAHMPSVSPKPSRRKSLAATYSTSLF